MPTIAIIGASPDRKKYGNKAVRVYAEQGYQVFPIHPKAPEVEGHKAYRSILDVPVKTLDMVSVYLSPEIGMKVVEEVAQKPPKELWLNPGAESPELVEKAEKLGLNVIVACSIAARGVSPEKME